MVYQGSKNRLSKHLIPIIQKYIQENDIDTYIELFAGGCNLIDKVDCKNKIAIDVNDELVALLKYAQKDNDLSIAPQDCSWEHYQDVLGSRKLKDGRYTKEYIALIGYMASFGGKYFGGYARDRAGKRNHYRERLNNLKRQAPNLKNITIECMNYKDFDTSKFKNALYYFDPPLSKYNKV